MTDDGHRDAPEVMVLPDAESASRAAAELIAARLTDAIATRGRVDWATTGGSTPAGIYRHLAMDPLRRAVDWEAVHLWWGDDRYVPRDHPLSNVLPADEVLIGASALAGLSGTGESGSDVAGGREPGVHLHGDHIHPFPTTRAIAHAAGAAWCAATYEAELREAGLPSRSDWPAFDLVLLGIGPDGHVLSVFPGSSAFDSADWAMAIPAPTHVEPHVERVTLNPGIVTSAGTVLVVIHGEAKAPVVLAALEGEGDVRELPARLAARAGATWILDEAAASQLHSPR